MRIGVLRPKINYPPPEDEAEDGTSPEDIVVEEAASASEVQSEPPSDQPVIGLDFTLRTNEPKATLEVGIEFAMYHPALPTREETEERFKQLAADEAEIVIVESELADEPESDPLGADATSEAETSEETEGESTTQLSLGARIRRPRLNRRQRSIR